MIKLAIHQTKNSIGINIYNGYWYKNVLWQKHLHKSFEFLFVEQGTVHAQIGEKVVTVKREESVIIFPYEVHSYNVEPDTVYFVAIFSSDFCENFAKRMEGFRAKNATFKLQPHTHLFLKSCMMKKDSEITGTHQVEDPPFFYLKASIYALLGDFLKNVQIEEKVKKRTPVSEIINYVESNFNEDISLKTMAETLNYDYHYISRLFNEIFMVNFKTFVNQYRCEKSAYLLLSTNRTVGDIAHDCGFQSVRTFNRAFYQYASKTPTEYRTDRE